MTRRRRFAALCLAAAGAGAAAQPVPPAATQHQHALRAVDTWLDAQAAYERLPSLAAAVVVGGETAWHRAWGHVDRARQVPAATDTIYGICSISKLFTSIAVMQLWEDGKLSLDDEITRWLPGFALQKAGADSGPITLRALLMHSAGLPREGDSAYWTPPDFAFPSAQALLEGTAALRAAMPVNDHNQYSNLGMALLGQVVAAAAGTPYDEHVRRRILEPLKLADTRTTLPAELAGTRLAQGFGAPRRDGTRAPVPAYDARGLAPSAGFSSTVDDLARFAAWQFRLRKAGGREVLLASTLREMQRVHWSDPDGRNTWGLGFAVAREGNTTVAAHTGTCPGQRSALSLALKEEVGVVVAINANDNFSAGRYTTAMRRLMLKGLKLPQPPAEGATSAAALEAYAGRYDFEPFASEVAVLPWGNGLALMPLPDADPSASLALLRHAGGDTFRVLREDGSSGAEVAFVRDAGGRIAGLRQWSQFYPRLAK